MFASIFGREFVIVLVIALLAVGGSQLPRLVRALTGTGYGSKPGEPDEKPPEPPPRQRGSSA